MKFALAMSHSMNRNFLFGLVALMHLFYSHAVSQFTSDANIRFKGAGWFKAGRIEHSSDSLTGFQGNIAGYTKNWLQDAGALFNSVIGFNEELEGSFGIGVVLNHKAQGTLNDAGFVRMNTNSFVNMARLTYTMGGDQEKTALKITTGLFSYKYDNNVKNLGLYLIRGPVYPGLLISSFESKEMLPSANLLGLHVQNHFGPYTQDMMLVSETDMYPLFDYSLIYVGTINPTRYLEFGAGVNFYHYLPVRPGLTSPNAEDGFDPDEEVNQTPTLLDSLTYGRKYTIIDTSSGDTTWLTHKGIKLMGRFALDLKPLLGIENGGFFNNEDFKLYSEVAVIGTKDYPVAYDNIWERIPVMVGFNIPTGFLNVLAFEWEYYASKQVPDLRKVKEGYAVPQSPYYNRTGGQAPYDVNTDNVKWSLYGAKVVAKHVKFSGQIALDHFRTGGFGEKTTYEEALTKSGFPKIGSIGSGDWYWMLKSTFFF